MLDVPAANFVVLFFSLRYLEFWLVFFRKFVGLWCLVQLNFRCFFVNSLCALVVRNIIWTSEQWFHANWHVVSLKSLSSDFYVTLLFSFLLKVWNLRLSWCCICSAVVVLVEHFHFYGHIFQYSAAFIIMCSDIVDMNTLGSHRCYHIVATSLL